MVPPILPVLGLLSPFFVFLLGESTSKIKGIYREECGKPNDKPYRLEMVEIQPIKIL